MKKLFIATALVLGMGLAGCIPSVSGIGVGQKKTGVADSAKGISNQLDTVIVALEGVIGKKIPGETIDKGLAATSKVKEATEFASNALIIAGFVPGPQQIYVKYAGQLLLGLGTLAGGLAAWFQRRKRKRTEKGLDAVLVAVDGLEGSGKAIIKETMARGVSEVVNERYNAVVRQ